MTDTGEHDPVGTILENRYRVEAVIGGAHAGGMVYRGRDVETSKTVVIRCPAMPERLKGQALDEALEAFRADAALLVRISEATNDVEKLIAHGVAEPAPGVRLPYGVFEWLAGRSLERYFAERGKAVSSLGEAMVLLEPAARALAAAHAMGAAHLDVRPANLWLAESDGRTRLKVAAFALASRVGGGDTPFAPEYGAPEHFKRSYGALGPATDVYGLALCLVEMMTGRRALAGVDPTELYLVTSDLTRRPTLRAHRAHVSDAVEQVVARALAVDPKRRWASAREFWDALVAAVPELTPAPPSVRPVTELRPMSIPPGATGPLYGSMFSTAPPPADSSVSQLASGARPRLDTHGDRDSSLASGSLVDRKPATKAWIGVAVGAAIAIGVVGAKIGTSRARAKPAEPSASASATEAPPVVTSAAPAAVDDTAVRFQPFLTDMVRVPAGAFTMGSDKYDKNERPAHVVTLTHAFYIDRYEVTAEAYGKCIDDKACTKNSVHSGELVETTYGCNTAQSNPRHPVNCVDRMQAEKYCASVGKRLPTEAEWEYAARDTDGRDFPWGNDAPQSCDKAVIVGMAGACEENRRGTWEVGSTVLGKSPFGALDMAGNVWEWVADAYAEYGPGDATDPKTPPPGVGARGVLRGGSYDYSVQTARTSFRFAFSATSAHVGIGFRCARDAE